MDAINKQIVVIALGFLLALALWKGTRKSLVLSVSALLVIGTTLNPPNGVAFPFDLLIWMAGGLVLVVGKYLLVNPKPLKQRWADHFRGFKEYRDRRIAGDPK